jgi:hypothetical protein
MIAGWDTEKSHPADIVRAGLDGIEQGKVEVLSDARSVFVKAGLAEDIEYLYPELTAARLMA